MSIYELYEEKNCRDILKIVLAAVAVFVLEICA
jgi:hypothetical protein